MATANEGFCAICGKAHGLKKCARCKRISYCSSACQRQDWTEHKKVCSFTVTTQTTSKPDSDALAILRHMPCPPTKPAKTTFHASSAVMKVFNTPELRLEVFSMLPTRELLIAQRVCRSWYLHVALKSDLRQRLFFEPGPGRLIFMADGGKEVYPAIKPRNKSQRDHDKATFKSGDGPLHLTVDGGGESTEKSTKVLEEEKTAIILNPLQQKALYFNKEASWRRMQLTSPPMTQTVVTLWITKPDHKGKQMMPETGHVATGVTLGNLADLLATIPQKFERHWMSIDGWAWWLRSADAVVVPKDDEPDVDTPAFRDVYVNPTNGLPFPGGF